MSKVRLTVDINIDDALLKENNLTLDELCNQITVLNHEVIDGFEITRKEQDIIDQFYLTNTSNLNVEVIEKPAEEIERLTKEKLEGLDEQEQLSAIESYLLSVLDAQLEQPVYRLLVDDILMVMMDRYGVKLLDLPKEKINELYALGSSNLSNLDWVEWVTTGLNLFEWPDPQR